MSVDSLKQWRQWGPYLALPAVAAGASLAIGYGFSVDDALITARVARQALEDGAYRYNPVGARVDCVTPLGLPWLMAPLATGSVWATFERLRSFGIVCHWFAALCLGLALFRVVQQERGRQSGLRHPAWSLIAVCLPLALSLPLGAWAGAGMETPLISLLCSWALLGGKTELPCLSLAAALRPELVPFVVARAGLAPNPVTTRLKRIALVMCGPLLVIALRLVFFGHPAPLAIFAKPAGSESGFAYLLAALRLLGIPWLLVAIGAWRSISPEARSWAFACFIHALAVVVAGGDWMPYFRLFVPLLPVLCWLGFQVQRQSVWWANALRSVMAVATCALLVANSASARGVLTARLNLSQIAQASLSDAQVIAALDIGWVGASAERAQIVDLAGLTDEAIARLPGGHTSKRLPVNLLDARHVDTLVLLLAPKLGAAEVAKTPWQRLNFARVVEQRVRQLDGAEEFFPVAVLPLGGTEQSYLVLRRARERFAQARP